MTKEKKEWHNRGTGGGQKALEVTDPEKFADFFVQFAEDPECNIAALSKRCGLSKQAGELIRKRLQGRYLPVLDVVEKVTTKSILKQLDVAIPLALDRMGSPEFVNKANYRDLSMGASQMIEKRQLLSGEPTQIMTFEERKTIDELGPALFAELKKRGKTIDVEYEDIPPSGPLPPESVSLSMRHKIKREDRGRV